MAYTYDDFVTAANNAGLMDRFSQKDLDTAQKNPEYGLSMLSLIQDSDKATTAEQRLLTTEAVNQLRKNYGIYEAPGGSFASSEGSSIQDTMNQIKNYGPFTYDPEQDQSYVNYRAAALRESRRATEDTLARASASTGGVASTAAVVAAQQAADYYNSQIADAGASFEQTAYQRYLNGLGALNDQLAMLQKQDAVDYNRYLQEEALRQQNTETLRKQAELMAEAGDFSGYKALGMSDDWIAKMQSAFQAKQSGSILAPDGYTVTNTTGDGYVVIGNSKITTADLDAAVASGQIIRVVDDDNKTVTYEYAHPGTTGDGMPIEQTSTEGGASAQYPQRQSDGTFNIGGRIMTVEELRNSVANGTILANYDSTTGVYTFSVRSGGSSGAGGLSGRLMQTAMQ